MHPIPLKGGVPPCTGDTCNFKGMVIYVDPKGFATYPSPGDATMNGNDGSEVYGTVYAPTCELKKDGGAMNTYIGQLIGYTFTMIGNATLTLTFNADDAWEGVNDAYVDLSN